MVQFVVENEAPMERVMLRIWKGKGLLSLIDQNMSTML